MSSDDRSEVKKVAGRGVKTTITLVVALALSGVLLEGGARFTWRETAAEWPGPDAPAFYVILPSHQQASLAYYLDGRIRHTTRERLESLLPLPEGALIWVARWPEPLSPEDAEYVEWLKRVGGARFLQLPSYYQITQVEPGGGYEPPAFASERFRDWYRPFDIRGGVSGFSDATRFEDIEFEADGAIHRWSAETAWLRFDAIEPGEALVLRASTEPGRPFPDLYLKRGDDVADLFDSTPALRGADLATTGEIRLVAPPGAGRLWVGWKPAADFPEGRGLRIDWVGVEAAVDLDERMA
jgi:hypothetical protein